MSQATVAEERNTRRPQTVPASLDDIGDLSSSISPLSHSQADGSDNGAERGAVEGKVTSLTSSPFDGESGGGLVSAPFQIECEADESSVESAVIEGEDSEGHQANAGPSDQRTERTADSARPSWLERDTDRFSAEERKENGEERKHSSPSSSSLPRFVGESGSDRCSSSSEVGSDTEVLSSHSPSADADLFSLLLASSEEGSGSDSGGSSGGGGSFSQQKQTGAGGFSGRGSDAEGSPRRSLEIKESPTTELELEAAPNSPDQLAEGKEKRDLEDTAVSADLNTAASQSPDPIASFHPASETSESSPHASEDVQKEPVLTTLDVSVADHPLAHVNDDPTDAEVSQTAPNQKAPSTPASKTFIKLPPPQSSDAKRRREKAVHVSSLGIKQRPWSYTPGLHGSVQLLPDTTGSSQPTAHDDNEDDDYDTPLLTRSSSKDSHSPSSTPRTTTTTTTKTTKTTNTNNSPSTRCSRLGARPMSISIPEGKNNTNNNTRCCSPSFRRSPPRMATSLEDITSLRLWKGIIAEFVGVLLLVLVGCGSCVSLTEGGSSSTVQIALCFGLSVATIVWNIGHISGGHINPAVTLALLATRKISLAKAVFFVLFQLVGAVVGAGILMGLTPKEFQGGLGNTGIHPHVGTWKGLGVELFITFVLVFTVFASIDSKRRDLNGSTPLTIGLSVTMCHLFAIQYTGASMNTARSFGPALVTGTWDNHWVYWVGPIGGGVVAGLLYEYLFAVNASLNKMRACALSSDYDEDKFKAKRIKVRIVEEDPEAPDDDDRENLPLTTPNGKGSGDVEDPTA